MSVLLLCVVLAGTPDETALSGRQAETVSAKASQAEPKRAEPKRAEPERTEITAAEPRQLFEIHKELRQLLRDEAVGKERKAWEATVVKLVGIYGEITRDPRLSTSDSLNGYRVKLRSRLVKVQKRLERELGSQRKTDAGAGRSLAASSGASSSGASSSGSSNSGKSPQAGAAGGAAFDSGLALVELIQRTISPEFWDVNGGPGTIVYYRQWHALVVRATPQIHRRIGGAVRGVRK
jgi:hypothetical protein